MGSLSSHSITKLFIPEVSAATEQDTKKFSNLDEYVRHTAGLIWKTWDEADKLWPESDEEFQKQVLIIDNAKENSWMIGANHTIDAKPVKELSQEIQDMIQKSMPGAFYQDVEFAGKKISLLIAYENQHQNQQANYLYRVITHETFHGYQGTWKKIEGMRPDLPLYPGGDVTRLQRLELIHALQKALEKPEEEQKYLQAAAWWYQQYTQENNTRSVDLMEGTANYFERLAAAHASLGIGITSDKINQWMIKDAQKRFIDLFSSANYNFNKTAVEPYEIDSRAGLLLDRHNNITWKKDAENAILPIETLLKDYQSVPQSPTPEIKKMIDGIMTEQVTPGMEALLQGLNSTETKYLIINERTDITRTSSEFRVNEYPNLRFTPSIDLTYQSEKGSMQLKNGQSMFGTLNEEFFNPNGPPATLYPLSKDAIIDEQNATIKVNSDTMQVDMKYAQKKIGKDGKEYYFINVEDITKK